MADEYWGIAGIGMLGSAIVKQFEKVGLSIGVYHPREVKAKKFVTDYDHAYVLKKEELGAMDVVIVALPAPAIDEFVDSLKDAPSVEQTIFINMATTYATSDLQQRYPQMKWMGMKCMAHAEDLAKYGDGLFVTEDPLPYPEEGEAVVRVFEKIGRVMRDRESVVEEVNKLATYYGIKAVKELEKAVREKGFAAEYEKRALSAVAPEVMRFYVRGKLGHFAKQVARTFDEENGVPPTS